MARRLAGIFAPITTPFVDEEVSLEHLRGNVQKYRLTPLDGFMVLGSNGESKSLTEDEKLRILETVLAEKGDDQVVMAGAGYESTRQTIAFSKKLEALGVDFVSLLTPAYFKRGLTDEAMVGYYTDVAEALTVPVLIYNAPGFTGMTISPSAIEKLATHPNIAGMKDTSPANLAQYLEVGGDDFDVLAGTINTLYIGLCLGARGGVVSLADPFPQPCCDLYRRFGDGDLKEARRLHSTLFRLNRSVSGSGGVAAVKYAMDLAGYFGGPPRLPLLPLKEQEKKRVREAVEQAGLL